MLYSIEYINEESFFSREISTKYCLTGFSE